MLRSDSGMDNALNHVSSTAEEHRRRRSRGGGGGGGGGGDSGDSGDSGGGRRGSTASLNVLNTPLPFCVEDGILSSTFSQRSEVERQYGVGKCLPVEPVRCLLSCAVLLCSHVSHVSYVDFRYSAVVFFIPVSNDHFKYSCIA